MHILTRHGRDACSLCACRDDSGPVPCGRDAQLDTACRASMAAKASSDHPFSLLETAFYVEWTGCTGLDAGETGGRMPMDVYGQGNRYTFRRDFADQSCCHFDSRPRGRAVMSVHPAIMILCRVHVPIHIVRI